MNIEPQTSTIPAVPIMPPTSIESADPPYDAEQYAIIGMREEDWPTTPEGIEELLRQWNETEAPVMSDEEWAAWQAWRQRMKEYSIEKLKTAHLGLFE